MSVRIRILAPVLAACLLAAGPAAPQTAGEADPPPAARPRISDLVERTQVRVLLIDLFVADRKGNPVADLKQGDFRLFIDGDPVEIDSFELREIPLVSPPSGPAPPRPAGPDAVPAVRTGQKVVLLFDAWNSTPAGQARVREQALQFLERRGFPSAQVMVLALGDRLRIIQDFTSDPAVLTAALRRVAADESDLDIYLNQKDSRIESIAGALGCVVAWNQAKAYAAEARQRARRTLNVLGGLIYSLGGLEGRKTILYFSGGLESTPGGSFIAAAMAQCGGSPSAVRPGEIQMVTDYGDLYAQANAANVTFHTVDTYTDTPGTQSFLTSLAFQTGGIGGTTSGSTDANLARITRQMSTYYTLGHTLQSQQPDGLSHNIRVEVTRPGLELRHRRKFTDLGWREKEERSVIGAMAMPEMHHDLPVAARILPFRRKKEKFDLYFEVGIPLGDLFWLPFRRKEIGEIEFAGALTGRSGKIHHRFRDVMELSRGGGGPEGKGVFYRGQAVLDPGSYELVAVAHDLGGGRIGGTRLRFEIPAPRGNDFSLGGIALGRLSRGDLAVGAYSPFPEKRRKVLPRRYRSETVVPLMEGKLTREDVLLTYLQIYDPRRDRLAGPPPLVVSISFLRDGEMLATHEPFRIPAEGEREDSIPFAMLTPMQTFAPGAYDLRVRIEEKGTNRSIVREVPFLVLDGEPDDREIQGF